MACFSSVVELEENVWNLPLIIYSPITKQPIQMSGTLSEQIFKEFRSFYENLSQYKKKLQERIKKSIPVAVLKDFTVEQLYQEIEWGNSNQILKYFES